MGNRMKLIRPLLLPVFALFLSSVPSFAANPGLILLHGKIVKVDKTFSVAEAMAIEGNRILRLGGNEELLKLRTPDTEVLDLKGRLVLPGLIDSHTHPLSAPMTEFDHAIPEMESIVDVLAYIKNRAKILKAGEWIVVQQVFITRLR